MESLNQIYVLNYLNSLHKRTINSYGALNHEDVNMIMLYIKHFKGTEVSMQQIANSLSMYPINQVYSFIDTMIDRLCKEFQIKIKSEEVTTNDPRLLLQLGFNPMMYNPSSPTYKIFKVLKYFI
jgi:predicted AAA+ superfamily ATPase